MERDKHRDQTEEIFLCSVFAREEDSVRSGWSGDPQDAATAELQQTLQCTWALRAGWGTETTSSFTETFGIPLPYSGNLRDSCRVDFGCVFAAWLPVLWCFLFFHPDSQKQLGNQTVHPVLRVLFVGVMCF